MNIQSLSIVVPNRQCINRCKFCVSRMHCEEIDCLININEPNFELHQRDYLSRMAFARDNGCNTVMLTGTSEPQQNKEFLRLFSELNKRLEQPFRWIEMQTTGVLLNEMYFDFLRNSVGVSTISISLSAFDDKVNQDYTEMPKQYAVKLEALCSEIKAHGFNLRLSVNLTDWFDRYSGKSEQFFSDAKELFSPNQMTLRVLYAAEGESEQARWVREHACRPEIVEQLIEQVRKQGQPLERLPYGRIKYSYLGMSLVVDDDCMSKKAVEDYKYLILQPNCRLYSRWDDPASLVF